MNQRVLSFKKVWIWLVALLCATAMATMAAPGVQQAFGDTLTNNGTVDNVIVDNNGRVDVVESNVVPDGKYEFSHQYDLLTTFSAGALTGRPASALALHRQNLIIVIRQS